MHGRIHNLKIFFAIESNLLAFVLCCHRDRPVWERKSLLCDVLFGFGMRALCHSCIWLTLRFHVFPCVRLGWHISAQVMAPSASDCRAQSMASNLLAMATNQRAMASNLEAMVSNLLAMASNLIAMAFLALCNPRHVCQTFGTCPCLRTALGWLWAHDLCTFINKNIPPALCPACSVCLWYGDRLNQGWIWETFCTMLNWGRMPNQGRRRALHSQHHAEASYEGLLTHPCKMLSWHQATGPLMFASMQNGRAGYVKKCLHIARHSPEGQD